MGTAGNGRLPLLADGSQWHGPIYRYGRRVWRIGRRYVRYVAQPGRNSRLPQLRAPDHARPDPNRRRRHLDGREGQQEPGADALRQLLVRRLCAHGLRQRHQGLELRRGLQPRARLQPRLSRDGPPHAVAGRLRRDAHLHRARTKRQDFRPLRRQIGSQLRV